MIYLFNRLYLSSDQYVRNDKKKITALLGPVAAEAKKCSTLKYDFNKIQLDEHVPNHELAKYLTDLTATANGTRVNIFTDDANLIKILAFVCASFFKNANREFIKELILLDKLWIESTNETDRQDFSWYNKTVRSLSLNQIDLLIDQGIAILPRLSLPIDMRMEYTYASYLNGCLPHEQKLLFEKKIQSKIDDALWIGDQIKSFGPSYLTIAHKKGLNLNSFTLQELKNIMKSYTKILDAGFRGNVDTYNQISLKDINDYIDTVNQDYKDSLSPQIKEIFTEYYSDKNKFIKNRFLNSAEFNKHYDLIYSLNLEDVNPYLWYKIASSMTDQDFLNKFVLNV